MRTLLALLLLPVSLPAAEQWLRVSTPHFELYTSAGETRAREAILYFEQVRNFFLQVSPSKQRRELPVRIIAFHGEKQYRPYRINEFASAYYTGNEGRDYIVMQGISGENYPMAIHEYTHLIIRHSGLTLPVWMNEGWADLYSTLRPIGNKVRIGDLQPGRLHSLSSQKWLSLKTLTSADQQSPYYHEREKAGIFYAQSWALIHMLYFDQRYRPNFNQLVGAMARGMSFDKACRTVLAIPMEQVEKDLRTYFGSRQVYAAIVDAKLARSDEQAVVTPITEFDSRTILADLLVVTRKTEQATEALSALAAENPARPEIQESWGYLAWQNRDQTAAREHFAKAVAAETNDAHVCYLYAMLEHSDKSVGALQRAVRLDPEFTDAWLHLGLALMKQRDYAGVLAALDHIRTVKDDQASRYFGARAFAFAETGKLQEARKNAEEAGKWAKTPLDVEQAASILRYLERCDRLQSVDSGVTRPCSPHP